MANPVGRPRKLSEVLVEDGPKIKHEISADEAVILAKLSWSVAEANAQARRALTYFLESLDSQAEIDDDEAKACFEILKQSSTSDQKALCNRALGKYVSKFTFAQPKKDNPAKGIAIAAKEVHCA